MEGKILGLSLTEVVKKQTFGTALERAIAFISPKTAYKRAQFRSAYEVLDRHRTRTKRSTSGGTGDLNLDEHSLTELREIGRDLSRNNPIAIGMLRTETNAIIGSGPKIEGRSDDETWNEEAEAAFKENYIDKPCDLSGRFNALQLQRIGFLSYRRDGDALLIFNEDNLQLAEGEQCGTPYGKQQPDLFDIINGVAYSKQTGKIIGYYIGKPNKWGYIQQDSWKNFTTDRVHHIFNPERVSFSRGEPALTQSIKYIDYLTGYIDAELVAAKVNACFSVFVTKENGDMPDAYTGGVEPSGVDESGKRVEKLDPGMVTYLRTGEGVIPVGQTRPGAIFDPFVARMLAIIGRPLCLPMMLVTLDFSGATFMNARIAYQKAQEHWEIEQDFVETPLATRIWLWGLNRLIEQKQLKNPPEDWFKHEVFCRRWPYVDPYKEAIANEQELKNATDTRTEQCARKGLDFKTVATALGREKKILKENELLDVTEAKSEIQRTSSVD